MHYRSAITSSIAGFLIAFTGRSSSETVLLNYGSMHDGYQYTGPLDSEGRPHGKGTIQGTRHPDPNVYTFQCHFNQGVCNGFVQLRSKTSPFSYTGQMKNDLKDGFGIHVNPLGWVYKGQWKEGKKHGFGFLSKNRAERYYGEWKEDLKHGFGMYFFPDGSVFIGEFINDEPKGIGGFSSPSKEDRAFGMILDRKINGPGVMDLTSNSNLRAGEFQNDSIRGIFAERILEKTSLGNLDSNQMGILFTSEENTEYIGQHRDGEPFGFGIQSPDNESITIQRVQGKSKEEIIFSNQRSHE